jgi:enterochelin esterase-like enzyme
MRRFYLFSALLVIAVRVPRVASLSSRSFPQPKRGLGPGIKLPRVRDVSWKVPIRELTPPFPNGSCGGTVITIPPSDTYAIDIDLAGNSVLLPPRPIQVWLPPNYSDRSTTRYPVLYCHDGQSAMEDDTSWTGQSWRLAGALVRLAEHNKLKGATPIVVLLPSETTDLLPGVRRRHLEYGDMALPFAQAHVDFVANTVKPLIDSMFSTLTGPADTYTIGASLGGQASLHMVMRHPDKFGGAACLSPAFGPTTISTVSESSHVLKHKKIYLDMGGDIKDTRVPLLDIFDHLNSLHRWNPGYWWLDTQLQPSVKALRDILDAAGVEHGYHEFPGARHNERAWSQRIDKPLLHLFGRS